MSPTGTEAHLGLDLPPLVAAAVEAARRADFPLSCRPEQGRLLQALAAGAPRLIGESGTGHGVGLAWLVSGMRESARVVSVERDPARAEAAAGLFADRSSVTVECADWTRLYDSAPFDLLVLDGGGQGKDGSPPADPLRLLNPGGVLVIDDFTPSTSWPPLFGERTDVARLHWMEHPALTCVEVRLADDLATLIGVRRWPAGASGEVP